MITTSRASGTVDHEDSAYGSIQTSERRSTECTTSLGVCVTQYKKQKRRKVREYINRLKALVPGNKRVSTLQSLRYATQHLISTSATAGPSKPSPETQPAKDTTPSGKLVDQFTSDSDLYSLDDLQDEVLHEVHICQKKNQVIRMSHDLCAKLGYTDDHWNSMFFLDLLHKRDMITIGNTLSLCDPQQERLSSSSQAITDGCYQKVVYFRLRMNRTSHQGHSLHNTDTYQVFMGKAGVQTVSQGSSESESTETGSGKEDRNDQASTNKKCILLQCYNLQCAYDPITLLPLPAVPNSFEVRHSMFCNFTFVDQAAILLLGYLPQDIVGTSVFSYYEDDDLSILIDAYKSAIKTPGVYSCEVTHNIRCHNDNHMLVATKVSCYASPFTKKVEHVGLRHRVIRGPIHPNVFSDPVSARPPASLLTSDHSCSPFTSTNPGTTCTPLTKHHQMQRVIRTLLTECVLKGEGVLGQRIHRTEGKKPISPGVLADSKVTDTKPVLKMTLQGIPPLQAGVSPTQAGDLDTTPQQSGLGLLYEGLNYTQKVREFLQQMSPSAGPSSIPEGWKCIAVENEGACFQEEYSDVDDSDLRESGMQVEFVPKPPSVASSTKVLISEQEQREEVSMPHSPGGLADYSVTEMNHTVIPADDYQPVWLTEDVLQQHNNSQMKQSVQTVVRNARHSNVMSKAVLHMINKFSDCAAQKDIPGVEGWNTGQQGDDAAGAGNTNLLPITNLSPKGRLDQTHPHLDKVDSTEQRRTTPLPATRQITTPPQSTSQPQNNTPTNYHLTNLKQTRTQKNAWPSEVAQPIDGKPYCAQPNLNWPCYNMTPKGQVPFIQYCRESSSSGYTQSGDSGQIRQDPERNNTKVSPYCDDISTFRSSDQSDTNDWESYLHQNCDCEGSDCKRRTPATKYQSPWLCDVDWTAQVQMQMQLPRCSWPYKHVDFVQNLLKMNQPTSLLQQMGENLTMTTHGLPGQEESFNGQICGYSDDERQWYSSDWPQQKITEVEDGTTIEIKIETMDVINQTQEQGADGARSPVSVLSDGKEEKLTSSSSMKSGTESDQSDSISFKGSISSDLTPSDNRSQEENASSLKESDGSKSPKNDDCECDNGGRLADALFVPIKSKKQNAGEKSVWLHEVDFNEDIQMKYQKPHISEQQVLHDHQCHIQQLIQPTELQNQLAHLLESDDDGIFSNGHLPPSVVTDMENIFLMPQTGAIACDRLDTVASGDSSSGGARRRDTGLGSSPSSSAQVDATSSGSDKGNGSTESGLTSLPEEKYLTKDFAASPEEATIIDPIVLDTSSGSDKGNGSTESGLTSLPEEKYLTKDFAVLPDKATIIDPIVSNTLQHLYEPFLSRPLSSNIFTNIQKFLEVLFVSSTDSSSSDDDWLDLDVDYM